MAADVKLDSGNSQGKQVPVVLVADDEPAILTLVADALRFHRGLVVVEAKDGQEAWQAAMKHRPQLMIVDVTMPKVTGVDLCRRVKGEPTTEHTKVLVMSAATDRDRLITALEAGADDYLAKPFVPQLLLNAVDTLLGLAKRKR